MSKKKYVIEKAFVNMDVQKIMQIGIDANGRIINWTDSIEDVEELNSDYINENFGELQDEAYKRGHEEGRKVGIKDGMCDAWEAARKIGHASQMLLNDMGFEFNNDDCFYNPSWYTVMNYTAAEAIAKLKAYEEKQKADDEIKIGDEVIWKIDNIKLIITSTYKVGGLNWCDGVAKDGKVYSTLAKNNQKTGKRYDIEEILKQMRS